jgi:glycosyltransferase involved in cell wall biosynthesis
MNMATANPIRVLHVVHALDRGGIETWLLHVLRHIDRARFQLDVVSALARPGAYDDEIRAAGARLFRCPDAVRFWSFGPRFKNILRQNGPYAVVHSHFNPVGYPLRWADQAGVPVRVAHGHNDSPELGDLARPAQTLFRPLARYWVSRHTTLGLAASRRAAQALFGQRWQQHPHRRVFYCGVDLAPFRASVDRGAVRRELGLPEGSLVVGHVGRFHEQKNHAFLIDVIAELARREPRSHLLLLGEGRLRPVIEQKAARLGLSGRITFAGSRPDVPRLMLGAFNVFALPSLYEGLPLVGIEAQAAGLPCVLSDVITDEVDIVPHLVRRLSLRQPPSAWADALLEQASRPALSRAEALTAVEASPFDIRRGVRALEQLYEECVATGSDCS